MKFNVAKSIIIKPSIQLIIFITFIHLGGMGCLFFIAVPKFIVSILVFVIGVSLYLSWRDLFFLQSPKSIIKITLLNSEENIWEMVTKDQKILSGKLRRDTFVSKHLILLRIDLLQHRFTTSIVLTSDALSMDDWRQLQVILRGFKFKKFVDKFLKAPS